MIQINNPSNAIVSLSNAGFIHPLNAEYPSSNFALADSINSIPILSFVSTINTSAVFRSRPFRDYAGGGLTFQLQCAMATATTGNIAMTAAIEKIVNNTTSIGTDAFGSAISSGAVAVPATAGLYFIVPITLTDAQITNLLNTQFFRVRLTRDTSVGSNAAGALRFFGGEVRS